MRALLSLQLSLKTENKLKIESRLNFDWIFGCERTQQTSQVEVDYSLPKFEYDEITKRPRRDQRQNRYLEGEKKNFLHI